MSRHDPASAGHPGPYRWPQPYRLLARRRRHLVVQLVCLGVFATAVLGVGLAASASQAAGSADPTVVVVQPHETLWSVAARHVPGRDPYRMIEEIKRLNGLPDHTIHPGQQLLVPSR